MRAFRLAALAAVLLACAGAAWAAPSASAGVITNPDWVRRPNMEQLRAVWPIALNGRAGHALIRCRVALTGALEACTVVSESPAGAGVGAAALLLTPNFIMRPAMRDGQPIGGTVSIPIGFEGGGSTQGEHVLSMVHPLWLKAPSAAEVAAVTPKGVAGHAAMRCTVHTDGTLHSCETLNEQPTGRGLGLAAMKLVRRFQLYVDPARKPGGDRVQVTVAVAFGATDAGQRYLGAPDWRTLPEPSQAAAIFPTKAQADGMKTGRAILDCAVKADGAFGDCTVDTEDPPGEGFGPAAIRLAAVMALSPWTQDGRPVEGAHIRVPVRLNLGEGAPAH